MIPETAGALLALLGLVAPGLVFAMRRERRQPPEKQTAFREAGTVALTSLAFTVLALAVLVPLSLTGPWLPDIGAWLDGPGDYVPDHYLAVSLFLLMHLALSCGLALTFEELTGRDHEPSMVAWGVWYHVLNRVRPPNTDRVWLWVVTREGTQFKGPLRVYTPDDAESRDLALGGAPIKRLDPGATDWVELDVFDAVIIPGSEILHISVEYMNSGKPLRAVRPRQPKSWLPRRR